MTDKTMFATSGWRTREVAVPDRLPGAPVPLVISGGWTSTFQVLPVRRTSWDTSVGEELAWTSGIRPVPFVLPGVYDSVRVVRRCPGRSAGGFARWRLRTLPSDGVPVLSGSESGRGARVFVHRGGPVGLAYEFGENPCPGLLVFNSVRGGEPVDLSARTNAKGVARIPGPGFVSVPPARDWTIKVLT